MERGKEAYRIVYEGGSVPIFKVPVAVSGRELAEDKRLKRPKSYGPVDGHYTWKKDF